jgi:addiction module RelB/DinJ family antitoxin
MSRKRDTIMSATNINISIGSDLEARAQSVLADLGLDMTTAFNMFLTQMVDKKAIPFEIDMPQTVHNKRPRSEIFDCMKIWMADDFDEPLEEMREYME